SHDHRCRAQNLVSHGVPLSDHGDDETVLLRVGDRRRRDGFMACGVEGLPTRRYTSDAEPTELREKLISHELDAAKQSVRCIDGARLARGRVGASRGYRTIEVVHHVEQFHEHSTLSALDLACDVPPYAGLDLFELVERASMLGDVGLE